MARPRAGLGLLHMPYCAGVAEDQEVVADQLADALHLFSVMRSLIPNALETTVELKNVRLTIHGSVTVTEDKAIFAQMHQIRISCHVG